ncbi:hypothetical protein IAG41_10170 [Sphingomonas sp. JC676]|uniref:hypothetical protein n=1 Tax=Sphingomonas sp. JC676 TaxID=2768065 RepID=UPI0016583997|nr:hypothetical protein [Sphingomonas sp. JC676]MBC9032756.1 hypothetical protein [Sphingomonas sp. JC676]
MANTTSRAPLAGGFLLSMSILIGAVVGAVKGEASFGFVIGAAVGITLALLVWLIDRMRG